MKMIKSGKLGIHVTTVVLLVLMLVVVLMKKKELLTLLTLLTQLTQLILTKILMETKSKPMMENLPIL